ncbi:GTPase A [Pontibacillus halophilus JSM 076056 = DSM 19796]|uniref:Small ribosomal subunit biogenesis GTPase RsgA n=1 Tax=Pontibacillus halophilus JSM 076056 = DSM 19796 TaxID=1385510 RepID=A0A0A5GMK0_9BACI|nr:ribosome small subunit-dependent GTPase A [Pontibacillus halophilus]KGX93214.1 GTPase A [Pontibacillus halophilus JSM 076056 = DSM 19796]
MQQGQIVKSLSGFYYVLSEGTVYPCKGRGNFRKRKITPLVGDDVSFEIDENDEGYILEVHERENELVRPPIANVDQAVIVSSGVEPTFNPLLLDRFLVLVESKHIKPIIVITKSDLMDNETLDRVNTYKQTYERIGYSVILGSSHNENGMDELLPYLEGKTSVIAGQSGVGKSSMLNALEPAFQLEIGTISKSLGRGKHTTRHVELHKLNGGLIADTPGFSSLEFQELEQEELSECFPEIFEIGKSCKFRGCMHKKEPKCAVKQAAEERELPAFRYEHYLQFLEEIQNRKPRY